MMSRCGVRWCTGKSDRFNHIWRRSPWPASSHGGSWNVGRGGKQSWHRLSLIHHFGTPAFLACVHRPQTTAEKRLCRHLGAQSSLSLAPPRMPFSKADEDSEGFDAGLAGALGAGRLPSPRCGLRGARVRSQPRPDPRSQRLIRRMRASTVC